MIIILSAALCWILLGFLNINAQQPLFNGCSSAGILTQPVWFNCDYSGTIGNGIDLHYKEQSGSNFTLTPMSPANEFPFYEFTYQTAVNFTANPDILEYYFSTAQDTLIATQSRKTPTINFHPQPINMPILFPMPKAIWLAGRPATGSTSLTTA